MEHTLILNNLLTLTEHPDLLTWEPFREGIEIHRLYKDGTQGSSAALLRYQPGATVPKHRHPGYEHIFVLQGSQTDHNGTHVAGTLVINPPQTSHSVVSSDGCIVLAIWEKPIELWS